MIGQIFKVMLNSGEIYCFAKSGGKTGGMSDVSNKWCHKTVWKVLETSQNKNHMQYGEMREQWLQWCQWRKDKSMAVSNNDKWWSSGIVPN